MIFNIIHWKRKKDRKFHIQKCKSLLLRILIDYQFIARLKNNSILTDFELAFIGSIKLSKNAATCLLPQPLRIFRFNLFFKTLNIFLVLKSIKI